MSSSNPVEAYPKGSVPSFSPHFELKEFDCRCHAEICTVTFVSPKLVLSLEKLRRSAGVPLVLNCGYRCPQHNHDVGGGLDSQHLRGTAADISLHTIKDKERFKELCEEIFHDGGLGIYDSFFHVDVRGHRARWTG